MGSSSLFLEADAPPALSPSSWQGLMSRNRAPACQPASFAGNALRSCRCSLRARRIEEAAGGKDAMGLERGRSLPFSCPALAGGEGTGSAERSWTLMGSGGTGRRWDGTESFGRGRSHEPNWNNSMFPSAKSLRRPDV